MSNRQYFWCIYNTKFSFKKNAEHPCKANWLTEVNLLLFIFVWYILFIHCDIHSYFVSFNIKFVIVNTSVIAERTNEQIASFLFFIT